MNARKMMIAIVLIALFATAAVVSAQRMGPNRGSTCPYAEDGTMLTTVADVLGIDYDTLIAELENGKTIADLAAENNIELQVVSDAVLALHTEHMNAAVEDGLMTQEQADLMTERMESNMTTWLNNPHTAGGFGAMNGMGFGMMNGMGHGMMHSDEHGMMGRGMHHGW